MPSKQHRLLDEARHVFVGGVNSPVRAFKGVGGDPVFFKKAKGAKLFGVDGKPYLDYVLSWGPHLLGHGHPAILAAIREAMTRGLSYGAPHEGELRLARILMKRLPWIEKIRFVSSGTEAVMTALRLARACTGRDLIVKFDGAYHGHGDSLLVKAGSGVATLGLPDSPGVPKGLAAMTLIAEWNDLDGVETLFKKHGDRIAAIIAEPCPGNMGVVPPEPGFLKGLRSVTRKHGSLLIFDEVMTGFRVNHGGAVAAYGVLPDLVTLGKVVGGGLPAAALVGPKRYLEKLAPMGSVYQAGTLSGSPLAMAAGAALLENLDLKTWQRAESAAKELQEGLLAAAQRHGIALQVPRQGTMLTPFFSDRPICGARDLKHADKQKYGAFFHGLLARGVYGPPSAFEAWFTSAAHDPTVVQKTIREAETTFSGMGSQIMKPSKP